MKFQFRSEVLCLPGAVLAQSGADAVQLRVLLWLASDLTLAQKPTQLAKLAECDAKSAKAAIRFWQSSGVLAADDDDAAGVPVMAAVTETKPVVAEKKLLRRADELPTYTSVELAELMEKRAGVRTLVDEAQRILGKMFNPGEINILVGMLDYLGICEEGILMILAHCKRIGKTNLRAIEKFAYTCVDKGITEPVALEEEFRTLEALHSFEGQIRALFGMKSRALTSKESKMLRAWVSFGYDIDIVRRAYEMTVNATNEPSMAYANAILERWNADELRTAADIDRAMEEQKSKKTGKAGNTPKETVLGNSFDTDDFFEAALKRSFREIGVQD